MDRHPHTASGFSMATLIDQDIAHIGRVMRPSMQGDFGGAILPATYWRKRLNELLARDHLTRPQLCAIDGLLTQLEQLDASHLQPLPMVNPANKPADQTGKQTHNEARNPTRKQRGQHRVEHAPGDIPRAARAPAPHALTSLAHPPPRHQVASPVVARTRHRRK